MKAYYRRNQFIYFYLFIYITSPFDKFTHKKHVYNTIQKYNTKQYNVVVELYLSTLNYPQYKQ
jgi:hypothetical protein